MASSPLSLPPPSLPGRALADRRSALAAGLFVAVLGLLLGSFPARNPELLVHLAAGRALLHGALDRVSSTWLYDVVSYGLFATVGGAGLVAVKAGVVAALAVVLVRLSRTGAGWLVPVVCTVLAMLAVGSRVLLAPATVSCLLLAVAVRQAWRAAPGHALWPGWPSVVLFALWGSTDRWFILGLGVVALIRVGRWLDDRAAAGRGLLSGLGAVAVLTAAATAANPVHLGELPLPAELRPSSLGSLSAGQGTASGSLSAGQGTASGVPELASPFGRPYLSALGGSPAALACYPLLGLGLVSFLLALPVWQWQRFLPWVGVAVLAVLQARAVPFFAVIAGPVLAWNLQDFFARSKETRRQKTALHLLVSLSPCLLVLLLICAWPGWLQRPPFEPRRWAVELPAGLEQAAAAVRRGHAEGAWPPGSRTLHLSRSTAASFAWFCPEDDGALDPRLAAAAVEDGAGTDERLAAAGVSRVVVQAADPGLSRRMLARLLADPDHWPLLHLEGGVALFGHGEPRREGSSWRQLDLDRLAFRPAEPEKAPAAPRPARRSWEAFWKPAPPLPGDRYQAAVLLLKAELVRAGAPARHLTEWEAGQTAALAGAAAGWVGIALGLAGHGLGPAAADAAVRLTVLRPPIPGRGEAVAPITRFTFDCQRLFALARDDAPPGVLYAAVRAARRAVADDPADAAGHLLLGQCYLRLLTLTRERVWALRLPQLAQLRQAQASAALNRAVRLNPDLARAHLELGRLYQRVGCLDLALAELRAYRTAAGRAGADDGSQDVTDTELDALARVVDRQLAELARGLTRTRVADRARAAVQRGLAGEARTILLESDVSAFGSEGAELELDLLLRTGRPEDVRDWSAAELKEALGTARYHWLRTQALAALGDYAAADAELTELAGGEGPAPERATAVFAALVGRALLDEQPGGLGLPAALSRARARFTFWSTVRQGVSGLAERADAAVLRGLLALEAGEVEHARAAFCAALACSADAPTGGGLDFKGRPVAIDALRLLQ
jgi:hypothetical protein